MEAGKRKVHILHTVLKSSAHLAKWLKLRDYQYKKFAMYGGWAHHKIGQGAQSRAAAPTLKGASWVGSGIWSGYLLEAPLEVFLSRQRTSWKDYISHLAWECLGVIQEELENVAGEKGGLDYLACCYHDLALDQQQIMDGAKLSWLKSVKNQCVINVKHN